jgi:hypothetical protein
MPVASAQPSCPRGGKVRATALLSVAATVAVAAAAPAGATPAPDVDVVASGLDNPRHVAVSWTGDVYVAEAGRGGDHTTSQSCFDSAEGFACTGATGAVTRISKTWRGIKQERVLKGLASFAPADGSSAIGPHGVHADLLGLLVTNGGPTAPTRGTPPAVVLRDPTLVKEAPISKLYGTLLRMHWPGHARVVADLWKFERDHNPDGTVGNPLVDSNPVDVWSDLGSYVVADAGGNTLLRVTPGGRVRVLSVFPNIPTPNPFGGPPVAMNAVPTGVVRGPDGAYYMSQLTGFPFPIGGAKVFRVDPRTGAATTYATGFTNAMDLAFGPDGTLYVLEIDHDSILGGSKDGALFAVPRGGGTPQRIELAPGTLTEPGGLAVGHRGVLYVSNHAREARAGEVLRITLDD